MAHEDQTKYFDGLRQAPTPADKQVPNTVSRNVKVAERSFSQVVSEAGKLVLDAELNVYQDATFLQNFLLRRWQAPSGWLRGRTHHDGYDDYITETTPGAWAAGTWVDGTTLVNSFVLPRLEALVAGYPVVVEYVNTDEDGYNLIGLEEATLFDGTPNTLKRTDFVFLEVWKALVAPSPQATGTVTVAVAASVQAGDTVTVNGQTVTGTLGVPGVNQFFIDVASETNTATNISNALNVHAGLVGVVTTSATGPVVTIVAVAPGTVGNAITLSTIVATPGAITVSGATLSGGADRPNKPSTDQSKLYRHGNVQSPATTWLDDELVDPVIGVETAQRVQIQYRIRVTGPNEGVNFKTHPDGFSTLIAGPAPGIFAQGGRDAPVYAGNPAGDINSYPFVPADGTSTWLQTSAVGYGLTDDGLWIAGSGIERSAQDLASVDGFVYAIPLGFVFRRNNISDPAVAAKGFDPVNNTNGGPTHDHVGYTGAVGTIAAGLSDRPDGEFCDVITQQALLDLRRHVVFPGVDLAAELQYQMQSLLDGNLRTWAVDIASKQQMGSGSGDVSTRYLVCNEIGREAAVGGTPPFSGTTNRGVVVRNFDHVARRFGDAAVVERAVFAFYPGDRPDGVTQGGPVAPGLANPGKYVTKYENPPAIVADPNAWYEDDVLHLNLQQFDCTTLGGIMQGLNGGGSSGVGLPSPYFSDMAPPGTVITDVLSIWHDDGHYTTAVPQQLEAKLIKGLGTRHLEIILDANSRTINGGDPGNIDHKMVGSDIAGAVPAAPADLGSERRAFVEVEITYPNATGLTDTPDLEIVPDSTIYDGANNDGRGPGPILETSITQRPNDFENLKPPLFRNGYRETHLEYIANDTVSLNPGLANPGSPIGSVNQEEIVSRNRTDVYFPRRVFGAVPGHLLANQTQIVDTVTSTNIGVDEPNTDFGSSTRFVLGATQLSGLGQTLCDIQYFAQDAVPNYGAAAGGYQVGVYFRSNAPQTAGVKEGNILTSGDGVIPVTLNVEPLLMSSNVWTGQVGTGTHETGYPYSLPLDQIPINDGTVTTGEWFFAATAMVSIDDFNANTGLLALHPFVQGDIQEILSFGGAGASEQPLKDHEFRAFYPYADADSYRPTIVSQPLYGATRHKVMVPFLARATEEVTGANGGLLYRKSELLLIVLSRFAELDDENNIQFLDTNNRTLAALYRTRNLLLTVGEPTCR